VAWRTWSPASSPPAPGLGADSIKLRRFLAPKVLVAHGRVRKVDVRLPGKGNSNSHGARPVHLIITMIKWFRTSRLSIKELALSGPGVQSRPREHRPRCNRYRLVYPSTLGLRVTMKKKKMCGLEDLELRIVPERSAIAMLAPCRQCRGGPAPCHLNLSRFETLGLVSICFV